MADLIFDPAKEALLNAVSIRDVWDEMGRRENEHAHRGTFVSGILMWIVSVTYVILLVVLGGHDLTPPVAPPVSSTATVAPPATLAAAFHGMSTLARARSDGVDEVADLLSRLHSGGVVGNESTSNTSQSTATTSTTTTTASPQPTDDDDDFTRNPVTRWYMASEIFIGCSSQVVFTCVGIVTESAPLLIFANANAGALVARLAVRVLYEPEWADWLLVGVLSTIVLAHIGLSIFAYRGGFSRYMTFAIGTDSKHQRFYREYQAFQGLALLDIEFSLMSAVTVWFFAIHSTQGLSRHWLRDVVFGVLIIMNGLLILLLVRIIRRELTRKHFFYIMPIYLLFPVAVVVTLSDPTLVGLVVPGSVHPTAVMTFSLFFAFRLLWILSAVKCVGNFGEGMRDVFAKEKTIRDFVSSRKAQRRGFASSGEEPPAHATYLLSAEEEEEQQRRAREADD